MVTEACATARNYDGPTGPIYVGQHASAGRSTGVLRIVTFNIKFGEHVDRAVALLSAAGPLHDADVLVLQEMDSRGTEQLAAALGMNYVYVPSAVHPSSHRDFGVAVLSPWPMDHGRKVPLPRGHRIRRMRRAAATSTIKSPVGALRVYAVHLETPVGASPGDRRAQARAVLNDLSNWNGATIVAGDFNGTGGAREIAKAGFLWLTRGVHDTSWLFDFDHILVRGLCPAAEPAADKGSRVRGISDHRPVWAVVRPCPV
jgi:endonuclease/exonuclease/phosphatase family metal-dependent hydrolase